MAFNPTAQNVNNFDNDYTYVGRNSLNRTNPYAKARMGSSEYMGESKTPQITKLIKENTNLNTKLKYHIM